MNPIIKSIQKFRLLELRISNSFLISFEEIFCENYNSENPYLTILIGPNGTRKSIILRSIINIFRELDFYKTNHLPNNYIEGSFYIKYELNGDIFEAYNYKIKESDYPRFQISKSIQLLKNDKKIDWSNLELPQKIIASTIMLTDKFPIIRRVNDEQTEFKNYSYLGVRNDNSPLSAGTRQFIRKTVEAIISSISKNKFRESLSKVLEFLDFDKSLIVKYYPKYKTTFFNQNLDIDTFCSAFNEWQKSFPYRKTEPWGKRHFDKIQNRKIILENIVNYLNNVKFIEGKRGSHFIEFEIFSSNEIAAAFPILLQLNKLDLISYPELIMSKKENKFEVADSSSGEIQLISSIIGMLAKIEPSSMILIDEPEISLHPNWQMKYVDILNKIFSEFYSSCHFVIATHSHFLISDLRKSNSSVIGLSMNARNKNQIDSIHFNYNTYGWSAEQILLEVFKVPTDRNYFIADKLGEILRLIAQKNRNNELITLKVRQLRDLNVISLSESDPLYSVWEKIKNKFNG